MKFSLILNRLKVIQLYRHIYGAMCVLLVSSLSYGDNLFVERIGIEQGLSQNNVASITQDHKGFMWFGTQTALNRYDGYTFKKYFQTDSDANSMSNSSTWSLLVDREGVLWAGTYGGLNRYDEARDHFSAFQHDPNDPQSISHDTVWSLYEDKEGNFWVGTAKGLNLFDRVSKIFSHYLSDPDDQKSISNDVINTIYQDSRGNLWIGTDSGLNRYHYDEKIFERVYSGSSLLKNAVVTAIVEDHKGQLWIGTGGNGIFILDQSDNIVAHKVYKPDQPSSLSTNKVKVIIKDRHNRIWIGTDNGGLNRIDENSDRFIRYKRNSSDPHSISENIIFSLYEDNAGVLWMGTYTQGISKLNPYGFGLTLNMEYASAENPDPHIDIRGFLVDKKNNLWVASSSNGIRVTSQNGIKISYRHDPNDSNSIGSDKVYSFYQDSDGEIWVGTSHGWLHKYNPKRDNFRRYKVETQPSDGVRHGKILVITEDSKGLLWLGDERGGAHSFNRKTKKFTHYHHDRKNPNSISYNRTSDIYIDSEDNIWFSSYGGGLSYLDRSKNKFTTYRSVPNDDNSISGDNINCIHADENDSNILWLGISGQGLDRFDISKKIATHLDMEDGLADNYVYGIVQDGSNLWLSHNNGISRFNTETKEFSNYEQQDGLQHNEFNGPAYYKAPDGKLYLGGILGYNAFYTDQITDNPNKPPVYITDFQLFNKSVNVQEEYGGRALLENSIINTSRLMLSYKDSVFSFEFSGLDYAFSGKNQYAYKMEGLEENWNYVDSKRRFATYTTLAPGDYTFRVKASNNNGVWNEEGASLNIEIMPPFWQTWWFRAVVGIFIILFVSSIYVIRVRSIKERNRLLKEQVVERTAELQKEKSNLESTLVELGETKDALIEAAHKAGMADTATGVLHNVGNILNSVNTSAGILREMNDTSIMHKFVKANDLLLKHEDDLVGFISKDPKGIKLLKYFMDLVEPFKSENETVRDNIRRLMEKINAINEAISAQQRYAQGGGLVEELSLVDIVEDSISLQSGSINRHEIKIERKYDENIKSVKLQKTKLVQILVNLYKNAKESMDACADRESLLTIEITQDANFAYIKFIDNGQGVEKDKIESIFAYGFTTKDNGHGFGLHSCANFMTEMGGKLWAESDGIDKGASFIMQFPLPGKTLTREHDLALDDKKIA